MIQLYESSDHSDCCHYRWIGRTNRGLTVAEKPHEWVWNQSNLSYSHDDNDRLTAITEGNETFGFSYD